MVYTLSIFKDDEHVADIDTCYSLVDAKTMWATFASMRAGTVKEGNIYYVVFATFNKKEVAITDYVFGK